MQGLAALFILLVSLILQSSFNPYENTALNVMETSGLLVSTFTLYVGLWTFEEDSASTDNIRTLATVIIFLINIVFLLGVGRIIVSKKISELMKKLGFRPKEIEAKSEVELGAVFIGLKDQSIWLLVKWWASKTKNPF